MKRLDKRADRARAYGGKARKKCSAGVTFQFDRIGAPRAARITLAALIVGAEFPARPRGAAVRAPIFEEDARGADACLGDWKIGGWRGVLGFGENRCSDLM